MILRRCVSTLVVSLLVSTFAHAQGLSATRFTLGGDFSVSQPKEGFGQNVGKTVGGGASLKYNLLRSGLLGVRFDLAGTGYGKEKKKVPISETIGSRVLVDLITRNTVTALSLAPELARPHGRIRPYVNAGYSRLFFRTTSSVPDPNDDEGSGFSTTNHKDSTGAWAYGGGVRLGLGSNTSPVSLDFGLRYYRGGTASYLQKGSIVDNPDGSITINSLSSRTPLMMYTVGVKVHIPHDAQKGCARFLC